MKFNLLSMINSFLFGFLTMGIIYGLNKDGIIYGIALLIVLFFVNLEDYFK